MIIDDDIDITNLFKIYLESNGYNVNAYTNPLDAFHRLENAKAGWNDVISYKYNQIMIIFSKVIK